MRRTDPCPGCRVGLYPAHTGCPAAASECIQEAPKTHACPSESCFRRTSLHTVSRGANPGRRRHPSATGPRVKRCQYLYRVDFLELDLGYSRTPRATVPLLAIVKILYRNCESLSALGEFVGGESKPATLSLWMKPVFRDTK